MSRSNRRPRASRTGTRVGPGRRPFRPRVEALEDRAVPATLTVSTTLDDVAADTFLTYREAITLVNAGTTANSGNGLGRDLTAQELAQVNGALGTSDRIRFETALRLPLSGTINIADPLPVVADPVDVEGPGAATLTISGRGSFGTLSVGARFRGTVSGLTLADGPDDEPLVRNTGRLTLTDCVVGSTQGIGLLNLQESFLTLDRVTVRNTNGGIDNFGILEMTHCTVSGNTRHGLLQESHFPDSAVVRHCTFTGNTSAPVVLDEPGAGGIEVIAGAEPVLLEHTIVAGNFRASFNPENQTVTNFPSDVRGAFATGSRFNLIGVDGGITAGLTNGSAGNQVGTGANPIDARLGPLADNVGPTPTHALLPGSPARDAGDPNFVPPPPTDQRSLPRVVNGRIDIGALEDQSPPPPPPGAIIEGQTFLDINSNGARDPGEPGLDGWTVRLFSESGNVVATLVTQGIDRDQNGVIEPETERGWYRFTGLAPGSYVVAEEPQEGATQTFPSDPLFGRRSDVPNLAAASAVTAGDFDSDGDLDLAVALFFDDGISFLLNNGNGTFTRGSGLTFGRAPRPVALTAADLDGDGDTDLAIANLNSDSVTVVRFQGLTIAGINNFAAGDGPIEIVAADLDGDGDIDLATANSNEDRVSFLRNNGAGFFAVPDRTPVGDSPRSLAVADLEGDGDADLFVANARDDNVEVLRNRGRGIFDGGSTFAVGDAPVAVVAVDLDGDGDPDLATANEISETFSILRNNGDRTFTAVGTLPAADTVASLTAADLDGDGDIDLAAANFFDNTVTVLRNNGDLTFADVGAPAVGTRPRFVTAADLNGDGLADLATANGIGNSVSVLTNLTGKHLVTLASLEDVATGIDFGNVGRYQVVSGTRRDLTAAEGSRIRIPVQYTTTDLDPKLSGLGLRVHFDSSFMTFDGLSSLLTANFVQQQVLPDTQDFDNDPTTDRYLLVAWADLRSRWPDRALPTRLFDAHFRLREEAAVGDQSTVRFSASSTAVTHDFASVPVRLEVVEASLDVDRNGVADALSDGQLIVRSLFGFTGDTLVRDALALDATRTDPVELQTYLEQIASVILDADGNGVADALTDGALVQRYLFGFRRSALVEGVVDPNGTRPDADDIVAFLDQFNPSPTPLLRLAVGPSALGGPTTLADNRQIITPLPDSQDVASGGRLSIDVRYTTDPPDDTLTGLGLRLHFDSRALAFRGLSNLLTAGTPLQQVVDDVDDLDNDPSTDRFVLAAFYDLLSRWSGADTLPDTLYSAGFSTLPGFTGRTTVRFTASSTALGYTLEAAPAVPIDVSAPQRVSWTSDSSGFWEDPGNWSTGRVPRSGDIAVISRPGADVTVTSRSGNNFLQGLESDEILDVTGGSIEVLGRARLTDLEVRAGALFQVTSGVLEGVGPCWRNAGILRIVDGSLDVTGGEFFNEAGGLVEIVPGGGDPGMPTPGGGDPGLTARGTMVENQGRITVDGRGVELSDEAILINRPGGTFDIHTPGGGDPGGPVRISPDSRLDNQAGAVMTLGATAVEVAGALINSGTLSTTAGVGLLGGVLSGSGIINGDLRNSGFVRPGLSTGVLTINGDYTQTSDGVLQIEVGGARPGTDHDRLFVTGTSSLAGALRIVLVDNFVPRPGHDFRVLSSELVGRFARTTVSSPPRFGRFTPRVGRNGLVSIVATQAAGSGNWGGADLSRAMLHALAESRLRARR